MPCPAQNPRRGITLLEVLISIGILAVGLASVVALVPAGKSEAGKAVMLDRSAYLAMNVLNDAITFGLTRPASAFDPSATIVIFDPLNFASGSCVWTGTTGTLRPKGISASGTDPFADGEFLTNMLLQGRDDLVYNPPEAEDGPPVNAFTKLAGGTNGSRSFQGRTSALVSLASLSGTLAPGSLARLTAVVFHNRNTANQADAIVSGTYVTGAFSLPLPNGTNAPAGTMYVPVLPEGRSLKDVIRPGTAVFAPPQWYQVAMASVDDATGLVYVTFVGDVEPAPGAAVQIALDSVGFMERIVTLEGGGPYGR